MKIPLTIGAYEAKSIIADAQKCVNLYMEQNPPDSPYPYTHYLTPGTALTTTAPFLEEVRGQYTASSGALYIVVGARVYTVSSGYSWTLLGTIGTSGGPVSMKDNSLALVLVDGSPNGYAIDLQTNAFASIVGNAFYGSDRVDYLDTYFIFNRPGTNEFYISLSEATYAMLTGGPIVTASITSGGTTYTNGTYTGVSLTGGSGSGAVATITVAANVVSNVVRSDDGTSYRVGDVLSAVAANIGGTGSGFTYTVSAVDESGFDPLDVAAKTGGNDKLVACAVMHREIWLIGEATSEVWYNSGAADFTFQAMPGAFVEHGCQAVASIAKYDLALYWLGQDTSGNSVVFEGAGYRVTPVTTRALANEINSYSVKSDAIGFTYLQEGHVFYVLTFPTEDVTWVFDITERHWHQRAWADTEGQLHRWRPNSYSVFNNASLVGDYQNGNIYTLDLDTVQDNGQPIVRQRSFPHVTDNGDRVLHTAFTADMAVGAPLVDGTTDSPNVSLSWSDNRGESYGNPVEQSLGNVGEYLTQPQWSRLGLARDRVYLLSWSAPMITALNGAYLEIIKSGS